MTTKQDSVPGRWVQGVQGPDGSATQRRRGGNPGRHPPRGANSARARLTSWETKGLENHPKAPSLKPAQGSDAFADTSPDERQGQRAPPAHPTHFLAREAAIPRHTAEVCNDTWVWKPKQPFPGGQRGTLGRAPPRSPSDRALFLSLCPSYQLPSGCTLFLFVHFCAHRSIMWVPRPPTCTTGST